MSKKRTNLGLLNLLAEEFYNKSLQYIKDDDVESASIAMNAGITAHITYEEFKNTTGRSQ